MLRAILFRRGALSHLARLCGTVGRLGLIRVGRVGGGTLLLRGNRTLLGDNVGNRCRGGWPLGTGALRLLLSIKTWVLKVVQCRPLCPLV